MLLLSLSLWHCRWSLCASPSHWFRWSVLFFTSSSSLLSWLWFASFSWHLPGVFFFYFSQSSIGAVDFSTFTALAPGTLTICKRKAVICAAVKVDVHRFWMILTYSVKTWLGDKLLKSKPIPVSSCTLPPSNRRHRHDASQRLSSTMTFEKGKLWKVLCWWLLILPFFATNSGWVQITRQQDWIKVGLEMNSLAPKVNPLGLSVVSAKDGSAWASVI